MITRRVKSETVRDPELEKTLKREVGSERGEIDYYYNRVDLNGDGIPEVLVFLFGPTMYGTGGCDALVLKQIKGGGYRVVSDIALARNPIIVSRHRTHGWNDLVMYVVGGSTAPGYYSVVPFDGATYPENASADATRPLTSRQEGTAYLVGEPAMGHGIMLIPPSSK